MSWKRCLKEFDARKITVDKQRAKSLILVAKNRKNFINSIPKKDENLMFIFESYYTLLIEIIHALAYKKGYDIKNHVCLGYFLKKYYNFVDNHDLFQKFRKNRNNLIYYGVIFETQILEKNIFEIQDYIKKVEKLYLK